MMDDGKLWNRFWVLVLSFRLLSAANVFWSLCFAGVLTDGQIYILLKEFFFVQWLNFEGTL